MSECFSTCEARRHGDCGRGALEARPVENRAGLSTSVAGACGAGDNPAPNAHFLLRIHAMPRRTAPRSPAAFPDAGADDAFFEGLFAEAEREAGRGAGAAFSKPAPKSVQKPAPAPARKAAAQSFTAAMGRGLIRPSAARPPSAVRRRSSSPLPDAPRGTLKGGGGNRTKGTGRAPGPLSARPFGGRSPSRSPRRSSVSGTRSRASWTDSGSRARWRR